MTVEYNLTNQQRISVGPTKATAGRPARIASLLALAHRFEGMVRSGVVRDYAELARLGHVTRARVTQIMNLLNLTPEIQEYVLGLTSEHRREITERDLRPIAAEVRWDRQRDLFRRRAEAAEGISAAGK